MSIDLENIRSIDFINFLLVVLLVIFLVRLVINPIWIQIDKGKVTIYNSIFGHKKFELDKVASVSEPEGYSFKIRIQLKNGKVVKLNSVDLKAAKKEELVESLRSRI